MPSPILTSDQYDIILSGGYRASEYVVVCPSDVVFAASVNSTPPLDVISYVTYDTVTVGAYTDIKEGMVILISHTSEKRDAFFRGRVRKPPIDGVIYVNETSAAIVDTDYLWVLNTYDITEKLRQGNYVDWDVTFHKIPPMVKDMQAAYCELTTSSTAEFTFEPVGQALTKSATIASYAWDIPGASYTTGSDTTQDIVIEVDTPYNDWGRLTVTDSNGVSNWFAFTITAGDPNTDTDIFRLCHDPVDYSADLENGYTAAVEYWEGVEDLIDRTRVAIVVDETYNDGDAELPNVRFVGYMMEDSSDVRGDERYGQIKNAAINLSGFIQLAGELKFNPITVLHNAAPTVFDQINTPTPVRCAAHVILEHSTLGNLAPIDWGVIDDTYFSGKVDTVETSVMDAANGFARKINASFTQDGGGQLVFRRNANFQSTTDRDALDTVTPDPITLGEGLSFSLKHTHKRRVGAVNVGFSVYSILSGEQVFLTARAPANGSGEGAEENEIPAQLLAPQADLQDAIDEATQRAGDWLEYVNPVDILTINIDDGFGFFSPSNDQWYKFDIPASQLPRGRGISTSTRWLCISIAPKLNLRGGRDIQAVFRRETVGGNANILVSIDPSVTDTPQQVLPPYPSYGGAWSPAASINYETTDPDDLQPFDPNDIGQTLPTPAEEAATQGGGMPPPGCARAYTTFKYSSNITMGFTTVLNDPYMLKIEGSGKIRGAYPGCEDLTASQGTWTPVSGAGEYDPGGGLGTKYIDTPPVPADYFFGWNKPAEAYSVTIVKIVATFNESVNGIVIKSGSGTPDFTQTVASDSIELTAANAPGVMPFISNVHSIEVGFSPTYVSPSSTLRMVAFCMYTATGEMVLKGDAFYEYNEDESGNPINVALRTGLLIDNAATAVVPPFNPNHIYEGLDLGDFNGGVGGTGNPIQFKFSDTDYTDNDNLPFTLTVCGNEAGS